MSGIISGLIETSLLLTWAVLFVILLAAGEVGYRSGRYRSRTAPVEDAERATIGTLVAAMSTLLAFALGLTISFAQSRFETRRDLVVQEANAIGTAWLRAGLFEAPEGPALRGLIQRYTETRLAYLMTTERSAITEILNRTNAQQTDIWREVNAITRKRTDPVAVSLLAAINDMIDLSMSQHFAFANRVPVYLLWAVLSGSMLSIGAMQFQFGVGERRQPVLSGLLLFMWTGAIILIIDLNRPRLGELRIDPAPLIWTIQGFGSTSR